MSDFYRELKPYMNKLSEFNVWDSLFVIRQYFHHTFKNYEIEKPNFSEVEAPFRCQIPVYFVDFLIAASLKYSTTCRASKSLRQYKHRIQLLKKVDEVYNKANKEQYDDIFVWLKSYMFSQFKMQHFELFYERLYKYSYLYSGDKISKHVYEVIGVPIDMYIKIVTLLYFVFSQRYNYEYDGFTNYMVGDGTQFSDKDFNLVLSRLITTINEIKASIKIDFSNRLFLLHNDAIHVTKPIIRDGNTIYCPIPTYILNSGIDGLQYIVNLKSPENKPLNDEVATRFEEYIGIQLEYYANKNIPFHYIKELEYNKKQNKTSDWTIYDDACVVFLDCKLKKLTIDGISATTLDKELFKNNLSSCSFKNRKSIEELKDLQDSALAKDLVELGIDLGKILCCYVDWKNGKIPNMPNYSEKYNFKAIVLTLEETLCILELKELIDEVAYRYVKMKKGVCIKDMSTSIISSATFDKSIPIISKQGIYHHVFEDNFEYKDDNNEINDFLSKRFDAFLEIEK